MIHIVLYRPEIPQNTGNIMRTCVAAGAHLHIIGPLPFDLSERSLKRAGMDYIDDLKFDYYASIEEFLQKNISADIYYVTRYADKPYTENDFSSPVHEFYMMFGRESTGIPHDILRANRSHCLRLPMVASARSLNLSNCVAIVLYEMLRQQKFRGLSTAEALKGADFLDRELNHK
jgi:tRNA (cytidine/uridine-2'-O-)-methyltransferase